MSGSRSGRFAAVDLGASSGRVMVGEVAPGSLRLTAAARFANGPVRAEAAQGGGLHWDVQALVDHATAGLATAYAEGPLTSVGVDSWAVDYGLLRGGRLVGMPFHYRDERRTAEGPPAVAALVGAEELYRRNGLQYLPFNTLYQLAADPVAAEADHLLMIPDLVACALAGNRVSERTNASTTGLLDVTTREWDTELMVRLGIEVDLFEDLVDPGHEIGPLLPHVAQRVGGAVPVVAVGSHDTASAVVGVPIQSDDAAYVSLGTWALAGLELDSPVLSEAARLADFTNEGGVDGTVRFLSNVMGTWLLSETLRAWGETDLAGMLRAASDYEGPVPVIDVQDERFLPPSGPHSDMGGRIEAWCAEHDVPAPGGRVATVRCIVESIAAAIASALERGAALAGRRVGIVHVVGGGAQNALLCQAIADRTELPVLAGPVEATALGNVLVQARAAGAAGPALSDLRALVAGTFELARFLRAHQDLADERADMRVALMVTCINDALFPDVGRAVVTLLRRLGVEVDFPEAQTCCGQPMVNTGYLDEAVPALRSFVEAFDGYDAIVTPSGSCAGSARHQHAIVARRSGDSRLVAAVERTSPRTYELSELLVDVLGVTDVGASFPHRVTYHPTCHSLRMLGVGDRPTRLLREVRGIDLVELPRAEECCGFGGTFAVKNADTSIAMVSDKARHVRETEAEVLVAGDSSCLMNIGGALTRQRAGVRVMHLAEVLAATESPS